jgi:hypothetical protein
MAKKIVTNDLDNKMYPETSSQRMLLEEYRALHGDYIQQKSEGITRMNFFITAMSVVLGGVLVFASNITATMIPYFRLILLGAIFILATIGLDVDSFLIQRNIDIDRDIRGMARIRNYFVKLDPNLEMVFVNDIRDISTDYLVVKGSGMRRSAEVIVGFLIGIALIVLSSYFPLTLKNNFVMGISVTLCTALFLEFRAHRILDKERINAQKFNRNVTQK